MPPTLPETTPASIDANDMRRAGRELLSLALMDARNHSLYLLSHFEQALADGRVTVPRRADLELPLWLAGHIGWLAEYWIGRNPQRGLGPACPADAVRLASIEPMADRWFNPAVVPHAARWQLDLPDFEAVRAYLLDTLESTLELLEKTRDDDDALYFFRVALFHEDLRCEQLVVLAQSVGVPLKLALPAAMWRSGRTTSQYPSSKSTHSRSTGRNTPSSWTTTVTTGPSSGCRRAGNGWSARRDGTAGVARATWSRSDRRAAP